MLSGCTGRRTRSRWLRPEAAAGLVVAWAVTASLFSWVAHASENLEAARQAKIAEENEKRALEQTAFARDQQKKAEEQADLADRNAHRASDAATITVRQMVELGDKLQKMLRRKPSTRDDPEVNRLRGELLTLVRMSLSGMSQELEKSKVSTFGEMATHQHLGDLMMRLGQGREALAAYRHAIKLAREQVKSAPNKDVAEANLGVLILRLGHVDLDLNGDAWAARAWYLEARQMHLRVFSFPQTRFYKEVDANRILASDDIPLGRAASDAWPTDRGGKLFEEAALSNRLFWLKVQPNLVAARSYVMEAHLWLGITASRLGDDKGMAKQFRKALDVGDYLVKTYPNAFWFKGDLAEVQGAYGDALLLIGKSMEAKKSYEESLRNLRLALVRNPGDVPPQMLLALSHERLAAASPGRRIGQSEEARLDQQKALEVRAELLRIEPGNLFRQAAWLLAAGRARESTRRPPGEPPP